jgi:hypothetical protein
VLAAENPFKRTLQAMNGMLVCQALMRHKALILK